MSTTPRPGSDVLARIRQARTACDDLDPDEVTDPGEEAKSAALLERMRQSRTFARVHNTPTPPRTRQQ